MKSQKRGKRILVFVVGLLLIINQSSLLSAGIVYGLSEDTGSADPVYSTTDKQDADQDNSKGESDPDEEVISDGNGTNGTVGSDGGTGADADLSKAAGADLLNDNDAGTLNESSDIVSSQDDDANMVRGPPEDGVSGADELTVEGAEGDTKAAKTSTVLAFTSDIHNSSDNTAANRLDGWLDKVADIYGGIDVMSFCGDMGAASSNESQFWDYTQAVMDVVSSKGIQGIITTGNHEFYNGKYDTTTNSVKDIYFVGAEGLEGEDYRIYCLGTDNWDNYKDNYTEEQIDKLNTYLNSVDSSKPIIILTHYPLHRFESRSSANAGPVIDVLNEAAASGKKIVLLWGHNHSVEDTNYDQIYAPGETIPYDTNNNTKVFNFYYASAGCMSDSEYNTQSAYVKGKGLVITINDEKKLTFTYYDANANDVTEGGTYTEGDPVDATDISVSPESMKVEVGSTKGLTVTYTPAETTNKKVTWSSSDTSVATVSSSGVVTGVAKGTATITATYVNGGFTDTCEVTVTKPAGQGVTPENGKKYVILANDGYALTSDSDEVGYTNGNEGDAQYNYNGLTGEEYTVGNEVAPERLLWTFTASGDGYYIQSSDGKYLNGTYVSNDSGGYDGTLKLDDTPDVWIITGSTSEDSVNAHILKSTNASEGNDSDKYLTHGNGDSSTENIFTLRSESNATATTFHEYADDGTYITDPDADDPTPDEPGEAAYYKLVDSFTDGKDYLIVSANSEGSAYALKNPGGSSSGASMGSASVTVQSGDIDGDEVSDVYISTEATDVVWTAEANGDGFNVTNNDEYIEGKSGNVKIYSSQQYADRYWTYTDNQLKHVGGSNTYTVYYSDGFTSTYDESTEVIYLYEKVEGSTPADPVAVTGVSLDKETLTLDAGDTDKLKATVEPSNATNKKVTWTSDNEEVATVSSTGTVTAVAEGTATITATTEDGSYTATCEVTVNPVDLSSFVLTDSMKDGGEYLIVSSDSEGSAYALTNPGGTSSGASMGSTSVTVQSGDIDGDGTADTYVSTGAKDVVWTAAVNENAEAGDGFNVTNNGEYLEGKGGNVKIYSSQQYDDRYWTYADNQMNHTGGSNTYTLYYSGGFKSTYDENSEVIYLYEKTEGAAPADPVAVTGVSLDKETLTLDAGDTDKLKATVMPSDATNKKVTWTSDNEEVATVSSTGVVTAIAPGTATITVTTEDGEFTASCSVTVAAAKEKSYVLTNELVAGKKYVIASSNTAGDTYILGHDGETAATYSSSIVDEGGTLTITTSKKDAAFEAAEITDGFSLTNSGYYMTVEGSGTLTFSTSSSTKYWSYADNKLSNSSSTTRYLTFTDNEFKGYYSSSDPDPSDIFLFVEEADDSHEHVWGEPEWTWTGNDVDGYTSATATFTCTEDASHVETVVDNEIETVTVDPTDEEDGSTTYTAQVTGPDDQTYTDEKVVVIPAAGYTYKDPDYTWTKTETGYTVRALRECNEDASRNIEETVTASYEVVTEPGCETAGAGKYTAEFTNDAFTVQSRNVEISALGHDLKKTEAKAATCTEAGNSAYWTCQRCGKFFADAEGTAEVDEDSWVISATGHKWGTVTYGWSDDNKTVIATRVCENDPAHVETETASATYAVTREATCTEAGEGTWTSAAFKNTAFTVQIKKVVIPATGHNWGEVSYKWAEDNKTVTATRKCANDANHVETETAKATYAVTKAASCEIAGEGTWTSAAFENNAFKVQTKTVEIPATGHEWGEAAYGWSEDYKKVTAARVCKNNPIHVVLETVDTTSEVTKAATCEKKGETTYTATFTNPAFAVQKKTVDDINAIGHNWGTPVWTWIGNDEKGYTSASATFTCANDAEHVATVDDLELDIVRVEPAPEETGSTTYTAAVTGPDGMSYTDKKIVIIPAAGYTFKDPVYTWKTTDAGYDVTALQECNEDSGRNIEETVAAVYTVESKPTCEEDGTGKYTATFANTVFEVQTKTVEIPAIGHNWGEVSYGWAENNKSVIATRRCSNDPDHVEVEIAIATYEVTIEPTCTEVGEGTWTSAEFENPAFEVQIKKVEIPELGHSLEKTEAKAATCTTEGNHEYWTCDRCGKHFSDGFGNEEIEDGSWIIPATGHKWGEASYGWAEDNKSVIATRKCANDPSHIETEIVSATYAVTREPACAEDGEGTWTSAAFENPAFTVQIKKIALPAFGHTVHKTEAKAATCTTAGNTEYWTCETCGKHFSNEAATKEIEKNSWITPATGHKWGEATYTWSEDNKTVTAERVCTNDASHVETEMVDTVSEETKAPTCEAKGETTYTATFTNAAFEAQTKTVENVDAAGHKWDTENVVWEWTESENGYTASATFTCLNDPSHVMTLTDEELAQKNTYSASEKKGSINYTAEITGPDDETYSDAKTRSYSGALVSKMAAKGTKQFTFGWTKVAGVDGYDVLMAKCNHGGANYKYECVKTVKGSDKLSCTIPATQKVNGAAIKAKTSYKACVKAFMMVNGKKVYVSTSPTMHAFSSGVSGKYCNAKGVKLKSKAKVSIKKGMTSKIKATATKLKKNKKLISKSHAPAIRYLSTNTKIATVTSKGVIKGVKKGTCYIYVYTVNGAYKKVKVTVK